MNRLRFISKRLNRPGRATVLSLILACCFAEGTAQNFSNKGREFWVGYGHHHYMEPQQGEGAPNSQDMVLYLSADEPAIVKVTIDSSGNATNAPWTRTFSIPANTVISTGTAAPIAGFPLPLTPSPMPKAGLYDSRLFSLPCSFVPVGTECDAEQIFRQRGIHIESDVPIVAYAHIYSSVSSGATMLLPVDSWGYSYTSVNSKQANVTFCYSWMFVIAKNDNTVVEITPSVTSRKGKPAGVPFTVTLQKGQIYQLAGETVGANGVELTGTKVRSIANAAGNCYPVAVFSGSSRTGNPCSLGSGGRDNDIQQLFPQQSWGKRYLTSPMSNSTTPSTPIRNMYKVVVKDPTTEVRVNGVLQPVGTLQQNSFYYYESNTADYIEANKPVMVAQYMSGGCLGGSQGDPEMIYISPIEQAIKKVSFYRNTLTAINVNYVTAIVPTNGMNSLKIDGTLFSAIPAASKHSYVHPNLPGYTVAIRRWTSAQTQATMSSDSAFTAITYGLGGAESYGYNAGTFLKNLNLVGSIRNPADTTATPQHEFTCKNTPVKLSAFYIYKPTRLVWKLSQVGAVLSPNADVTDLAPVAVDSSIIDGVKYYKYTCPGTYTFSDTGTYNIPIASSHPTIENCYFTEDISYPITVKPTPRPNFSYNPNGQVCEKDTITFSGIAPTLNGYNIQKFKWTFPGPALDSGQVVRRILPGGNQPVQLQVVTTEGCLGDTTQTLVITAKPVADFNFAATPVCEKGSTILTDNSSYGVPGAINNWYWDFGNGNTNTVATNAPQTPLYNDYGPKTVRLVVKVSNTCISDTTSKPLTVYAKPRTNFSFPLNCLPTTGLVQFTDATTVPDGQTFSSYAWIFGDPNANGGNPNTSALQNPTHIYQEGNYPVNLNVTSQQGCVKDTTINATFKITPALNYPALAGICVNAAPVSIATASVTNGVTGAGVYAGPGTTAAGQFNPALAGVGTHTVWYKFTTTGGCTDSIPQTILVKAKPVVSFTHPALPCLPTSGLAQFNGAAALADAQTIGTWAWNFNDPNANAGNPNTSGLQNPSHNFISHGIYNVNLTAVSSGSCTGDTTITLNMNTRAALAWPVLAAVCQNVAGTINVATASVTNGVTGAGTYSGPGTSAAGLFTPSLAGPGVHTLWYKFVTPLGCADSIPQTIQVRAKPVVSFTHPAPPCLPTDGVAQFNGSATLADAQTLSYWAWNFNDPNATAGNPNTSSQQNPSHFFTANGTYNVNLTVGSSGGCTGDTTITLNFNTRAALNYPALAPICESVVGTISIATATVTNGVTGTGTYSGPGTSAAGLFSPSVAGAGLHTIWYKFVTPLGCADSIPQTIRVHPKPAASFTVPPATCAEQAVTLTNTSTISSGNIVSWRWDFGDGSAPVTALNGNPVTHTYTTAGPYTARLVTVSDNGCVSDTATRNFTINPLPVVNYTNTTSVCLPGGVATFTNTSTLAGGGTLNYTWNYGDGSPVDNSVNGSHVYAAAGNYAVTLTAASAAGCSKSLSRPFSSFFNKPVALFEVNPDTLCQGNDNTFIDRSTDPSGSPINSWKWNFKDGSAINTQQNPVKRFSQPGLYYVTLQVTNQAGCISEPDSLPVVVYLQPVVDAGPSFVVQQGASISFDPVVNATAGVSYQWSPATGLSSGTALKPTLVAQADQTYTLTVTGTGGCTASDFLTVKVRKAIKIPNAFSPNGDGVNDTWAIENLVDYTNCLVQIFNRYGQKLWESTGYSKPWNGGYNNYALPVGTYYYVIDLRNGTKPYTGAVTLVR